MFAVALTPGLLGVVNVGNIVAICAGVSVLSGGIVGLIFRGAAAAWKTERDAAVDKADRLDKKVAAQATEIATLQSKVSDLEKRTDYERYAERSANDHKQILDSLREVTRGLHANTVATEFLIKQAFPDASLAFREAESPTA